MKEKRSCSDDCKDKFGKNCYVLGDDKQPVQCVGPWVESKYFYLERYLDATRGVRKKFTDKGNSIFIDFFTGPGRCAIRYEDREIDNGALRVIKDQSVGFSKYYLIDIVPENVEALKFRIGNKSDCEILCEDSNKYVYTLITKLSDQKYDGYHFVYLDPYGPEALPFSTLEECAKLKRLDLFIHFPIGAIRRSIQKWSKSEYGILDDFLGTTEWRDDIKYLKKGRMLNKLLQIYERQLLYIGFPQDGLRLSDADESESITYPIASVRNRREVELYVLVLASKHGIAQKIWNSVLMIDDKGQKRFF